ncbi:N-acetyltransferase [Skermania sp. ID1734]|uniref:GNAT family N-acetyltransferase n=1 Tax=Skermania sp. ID1734 TaxID=2597516 RepID=UPI00117C1559|nr:GNAT family N-acetyltransferase [Skermania sp. ID1734]TSE01164.1 N-acetyltransferase [Skermania sp. ID1734]
MSDVLVRDAEPEDLPAILRIHNVAITSSTAIWDTETVDLAEREAWLAQRRAAGFPVFVAVVDDQVVGYASYGPWRPKSGYRHTAENSVYIADGFHRRGIASLLLAELIAHASESGIHALVAGIESSNHGSIALHERFGFRIVGQLPEVGRKFDRWLDLTLMQLQL